ncbi:MAG: DUF2065 domain-containing protein [Hydrogenophilales bacterium]|nr:DUF2065 domain-containing protein [Hydrogenophilales bacterium]
MNSLLAALGLVLVLEGALPFLAPSLWRDTFRKLLDLSDGQLRFMGLISMLMGLGIVFATR